MKKTKIEFILNLLTIDFIIYVFFKVADYVLSK